MGSKSDWETLRHADEMLTRFDVPHEMPHRLGAPHAGGDGRVRVQRRSARHERDHRRSRRRGAPSGDGRRAHALPVLGVPVESHALKGMDSLLSIVQMPAGVPVATLAIGKAGATNAALLAVAILATIRPAAARKAARLPRGTDREGQAGLADMTHRAHPSGLDHRRARQRTARAHVRDGGPPPGVSRSRVVSGYRTRRPARWPMSRSWRRTTISMRSRHSRAAWTSSHSNSRTSRRQTTDAAAAIVPVRPSGLVLHIAQQRAREKGYLADKGFPVTPFAWLRQPEDLEARSTTRGLPAVLKTASFGYDGKGQVLVETREAAREAWRAMDFAPAVLERFIQFDSRAVGDCGTRTGRLGRHLPGDREHARQSHSRHVGRCRPAYRRRPRCAAPARSPAAFSKRSMSSACCASSSS